VGVRYKLTAAEEYRLLQAADSYYSVSGNCYVHSKDTVLFLSRSFVVGFYPTYEALAKVWDIDGTHRRVSHIRQTHCRNAPSPPRGVPKGGSPHYRPPPEPPPAEVFDPLSERAPLAIPWAALAVAGLAGAWWGVSS